MDAKKIVKQALRFHPQIGIPSILFFGGSLAFENHYRPSEVLFLVCAVWSIGLWIISGQVAAAKDASTKLPNKKHKMPSEVLAGIMLQKRRDYLFFLWKPIVALGVLGIAAIAICEYEQYQWELQQTLGILTPANDPMPDDPCSIKLPVPDGAMRVFAGGGMNWTSKNSFALVEIGDQDLLSVERHGREIFISGDIYTPDGDAVHIEGNRFETPDSAAFKPRKPDKHTLQVLDKWHKEVLSLRFLNANAIRVRGTFWKPGRLLPVVIDNQEIKIGGFASQAPCSGNANVAVKMP